MGRIRQWADDSERRQVQNERRKLERASGTSRKRSAKPVKFIALDGEGCGKGENHRYVLLGAGTKEISSERGLYLPHIFSFLYGQFRADSDSAFVGFFLGYDFNQWLKQLPENKAWSLFHPESRQRQPLVIIDEESGEKSEEPNRLGPWPVRWKGWEFDILGMKRFKLRPESGGAWLNVCDAGPFFQSSLMSVIDPRKWDVPVVSGDEYAILEEGKKRRDSAVLDNDMRYYNKLENDVLTRLMERTDAGLQHAGIRLAKDQWFGPGQAAQKWLASQKIPDRAMVRSAIPAHGAHGDILHKGRMTYYGGWFEIFAHGHIPGTTWEYDINSAYPHVLARLPCLLHGKWRDNREPIKDEPGINRYRMVHAEVHGTGTRIGAMLHRRPDGSVVRPLSTAGYYWESELSAAIRAGMIDEVKITEGIEYEPCSCDKPLRKLADLYHQRIRIGKNTPEGKALKLIYNSIYGKFAQSVGDPRYSNALYASLTTSGCREMICNAIADHPEGMNNVVMVATDGVYFRTRHGNLPVSKNLGEWEENIHENMCLFKPGVYWDDTARQRIRDGEDPCFKARGISARTLAQQLSDIDHQFHSFRDTGIFPSVVFQSGFSMITCLQALQRRKWSLAGFVGDRDLTQDSDPVQKRRSGEFKDDVYWSKPYKDGGLVFESTSYEKTFGLPSDPEEYGITDDGTVKDSWAELLK